MRFEGFKGFEVWGLEVSTYPILVGIAISISRKNPDRKIYSLKSLKSLRFEVTAYPILVRTRDFHIAKES